MKGEAIIVIGSSYVNGTTRIDDNFFGTLNGLAVMKRCGYTSPGLMQRCAIPT